MINKPYKINRNDYDEIYFTSDQHYNHNPRWDIPLWKQRGFSDVNAQDEWLRHEYSKISSNSLIISLGDPALNSSPESLLNLFNQTAAPIWTLFGNHFGNDYSLFREGINTYNYIHSVQKERLNPIQPLEYEIYPFTVNRNRDNNTLLGVPGFHTNKLYALTFLGTHAIFNIGNSFFNCQHMAPLVFDKMKHDNFYALCGHSHGNLTIANPEHTDDGRLLDCGVDNSIKYNGTAFFEYEEVLNIMKTKKPKFYDHHSES